MRVRLALALLALAPAAADGYFAPGATVVSASPARQELADDASQFAAVSGDARYIAVQTRATNLFASDDADPDGTDRLGGVFRRDLQTGELAAVADGDLVREDDGSPITTGARNPSISADGRFVAFSTGYALVPADTNGSIDVYVRDMDKPRSDPAAYTLVSALDGASAAAAYSQTAGDDGQRLGAEIWPGTSMSADGTQVAFRTVAVSDLAGKDTPAGQLFVRDLATQTTRLVTTARAGGAPAGGAAGPVALSADGSALVWTGANAAAQTAFLTGEPYSDVDAYYLWKRLSDGPLAPTRRITGIVDLDDPGCAPGSAVSNDPAATGPCYGPLTTPDAGAVSITGRQLAISGNGNVIWYLTPAYPRPTVLFSSTLDLWRADMGAGTTRKAGALELTREGASDDAQSNGGIEGMAVTPDGRWLALVTTRTRFTGGALLLSGPTRSVPDAAELYLADLTTGATERAVTNYGGGDASGPIASRVSISANGSRIGFTSTASNLFFGDANARADAFVVTRTDEPVVDPPDPPDSGPDDPIETPPDPPTLKLRVAAGVRGTAVLVVTSPVAGRLTVTARGRIPAAGGKTSPLRTFATAAATAKAKRPLRLVLRPAASLRRALKRFGRLRATARAVLVPAAGGTRLVGGRPLRFLAPKRPGHRQS